MVLICHVIKQNHETNELSNFMVGSLLNQHLTKFGGHRHCSVGDIIVLVCHMISQDYVMKGSCAFIATGQSR